MDALVLARVCRALERRWAGAWVQRVRQDREGRLFLQLYREGRAATLIVSGVPGAAGLGIAGERPASPPRPGALAAYLRAHAQGGRLEHVGALPYERVARLDFSARGESVALILEALPREPRLFALDAGGTIRAADRWDPRDAARSRPISAGTFYRPPDPPPGRIAPESVNEEEAARGGSDLPDRLLGFPPWLRAEFEEARERCGALEAVRRYALAYEGEAELVVEKGGPRLLHPLDSDGEAGDDEEILAVAGRFLQGVEAAGESRAAAPSEARRERKWRQRLERRLRNIEADLAACPDPAGLRAAADALAGCLGRIPPAAGFFDLPDIPAPGEHTRVELDPRLSPGENLNRAYEAAKKAGRTRKAVEARLDETRRELAAGPPPEKKAPDGKEVKEFLPFRRYVSSDGWPIWVGRNGPENDRLLREARPWDLWLHARGGAGAHVLVRRPGRESKIPPATLREAAGLAALFSKFSGAAAVEVMAVEAARVRKVRGASPGRVTVTGESTVRVPPGEGKARPV